MTNLCYIHLPGIPPAGTPQSEAFWSSFWPALWSGIIYSIVTGLIVGFVILASQRKFGTRQLRQQCARELSVALERLRSALNKGNPLIIGSAADSLPAPAAAAEQALSDQPVSLWIETLADKRQLLSRITDLQQAVSRFRDAAHKLDAALHQYVRADNASKGIIAVNDATGIHYCVGRIQGASPPDILPWIGLGMSGAALPGLEETFTSVQSDDRVAPTIKPYVEAKQRVTESLTQLTSLLERNVA